MTLEELRNRIPAVNCRPGCTECCTCHAAMSEMEAQRIQPQYVAQPDYIYRDVGIFEFCMFMKEGAGCGIYEERPIRCRLFGTAGDEKSIYSCSFGCRPDKPLNEKEIQQILDDYEQLTRGQNEYVTVALIKNQLIPVKRGENG